MNDLLPGWPILVVGAIVALVMRYWVKQSKRQIEPVALQQFEESLKKNLNQARIMKKCIQWMILVPLSITLSLLAILWVWTRS